MPQNGPGPMPANSTMRSPASGPAITCLPVGRALFSEGRRAFARVLAHEHLGHQLALLVPPRFEAPATRFLDHLLGDFHRERTVGGDRLCQLHRPVHHAAIGHPVDQAQLVSAGGVDEIAGQRQFHRDLGRDLVGQFHQAAGRRDEAALDLGNAELRTTMGDHHVARDHQFEPACQRIAFDSGDDRLGRALLRQPTEAAPFYDRALAAQEALEVHARTEGAARAGQDRNAQIVFGIEPVERGGDAFRAGLVHRVLRVGAVDGDDENAVLHLGQNIVAHVSLPCAFAITWRFATDAA